MMNELLDTARTEVRLSLPVVDRLRGRLCFSGGTAPEGGRCMPVDVAATNEALVLGGRSLQSFVTCSPGDPQVLSAASLVSRGPRLAAEQILVVLLCGGLSFRSGGKIQPLLVLEDPHTGRRASLLDRQLDRLAASPLCGAQCIVVGSPLNQGPLGELLSRRLPSPPSPQLCMTGLGPRLLPCQPGQGELVPWRDEAGRVSYNPLGHFEALRWLVLSGSFEGGTRPEIVIVMNYSNWGRVFTEDTLSIAAFARDSLAREANALFVAEVVARHPRAEKGSFLARNDAQPDKLCLVKPGYGRGGPRIAWEDEILLSTNTLYFSVANLMARLAAPVPSQPLWSSLDLDRRAVAFDKAFPVPPFLIPTPTDQTPDFLRMERDLDQVSLLPGHVLLHAVQVPDDRAVFVKLPEDLDNPEKTRALFSQDP